MDKLRRRGGAWMVWAILFVPYAYMAAVVMPNVQAEMEAAAADPSCARPLDLRLWGFTEMDVAKTFSCLGEAGLAVYTAAEQNEDVIYPLLYGVFLAFTLFHLCGFAGIRRNRMLVAMLPLLAMGFDLVENFHIVQLAQQFPLLDKGTLHWASLGNQFKWSFAFASIGLILIFLMLGTIRELRSR
jgi:hypothetical protein